MEKRLTIRSHRPQIRKPNQRRLLPFFQKKDDDEQEDSQGDDSGPPPPPGLFKGKGKGLLNNPFLTVTTVTNPTATVTSVSTLTVAPPALTKPETTPKVETSSTSTPPRIIIPTMFPAPGTTELVTSSSSTPETTAPTSAPPSSEPGTTLLTITTTSSPEGAGTGRPTYMAGGVNPDSGNPPIAEGASEPNRLSSNQAVGVAIGAVFGFIVILALLLFGYKRWRRRRPRSLKGGSIRSRGSRAYQSLRSPTSVFGVTTFVRASPPNKRRSDIITKPKQSLTAWLQQIRPTRPSPSPEDIAPPVPGKSEKASTRSRSRSASRGPRGPPRSFVSNIFNPSRLQAPPSREGGASRGGGITPSTDERPSRAHLRQSAFSEASQWTGAPTHRTDSGIFVPPTALSHPRVIITSPIASPMREPPMPVARNDVMENAPAEDHRRTVRFSGQEEGQQGFANLSAAASLVSADSRSETNSSTSSRGT